METNPPSVRGPGSRVGGKSWPAVFCAVCLLVSACCTAPAKGQHRPRFVNLTKEEGLSDNSVEAILEDHRGFMWLGSTDGLNRYDAHSFKVYRHDPREPASLSDSHVASLFEDRGGVLWIGTLDGLNRYERETDSFTRFQNMPAAASGRSSSQVNEIYEDRDGKLWITTGWGFHRFDRATEAFVHFAPEQHTRIDADCPGATRPILEDRRGDLWIGFDNCGLVRFDRETGRFDHFLHDDQDPGSLSHDDVWDLLEDRDGDLWIATMGGLNRFEASTGTFTRFGHEPGNSRSVSILRIEALLEDSHGRLWVGTDGRGLNTFDRQHLEFAAHMNDSSDPSSIGSNVIRTIYEDSKGDIWVGTFTGGVGFYSDSTAVFSRHRHREDDPQSLSHSAVLSFFEEENGTLWIGTEGGLNHLDRETGTFRSYRHDENNPESLGADAVLSVLRDSRGHLWAGTYHGGLNRLQEETDTFTRYQPEKKNPRSIGNQHIWDVFEDSLGGLWLGTFNGVSRFDYDTEGFIRYVHDPSDETSVGHDVVRRLYEDSGGTLWLATLGGLSRYDREQDNFRTYRKAEVSSAGPSHNNILSIMEDREGRLWIGTEGGGLNRLDRSTETFKSYHSWHGLPSDVVYCTLEDDRGRLWISANDGLARLDPGTEVFTNYTKSDGILVYPFFYNACLESRSGEMFFGGVNGFSSFFPDAVKDNAHIPPVVLTDFQVFNRPVVIGTETSPLRRHITEAKRLELRHDQSVISFTFSALNYRGSEMNRYSYKLENFDKDWTAESARRTATYTNLDPGTYVFRARGSNNSGRWNERGASIEIVVQPPFWATWWFRAACLAAALMLLILIFKLRTRSIRARNVALQAEINERKRVETELDEKNTVLEQQNAELERFAFTVSHDLKTPLVTIKGFLGMLEQDLLADDRESVRKDIDFIHNAADHMYRLLHDLLELSRVGRLINPPEIVPMTALVHEAVALATGAKGTNRVAVEIEPSMPAVFGDKVRLLEVLQNLVENAIKFMGEQSAPRIEIGASQIGGEVLCYVRDNGKGIDPRYHEKVFRLFERLDAAEEGTGVGLALVKRIVEVHGGRIWVDSPGVGHGSVFSFSLPAEPDSPAAAEGAPG